MPSQTGFQTPDQPEPITISFLTISLPSLSRITRCAEQANQQS
ncbi:MAG: hypothetical protein ACUVXA_02175 [Candidatus Jordarchaeum sp.]